MTAHLFIGLDRIADLLAGHANAAEASGDPFRAASLRRLAKEVRAVGAPPTDEMIRVVETPPEGVDFDMT